MIHFFRKIRKQLLTENKFSRYLLYAIGEIVLVVIGIMIALQVNDWNQNRNQKILEIEVLKDFKSSLESELKFLNAMMTRANKAKDSLDLVLDHLEGDLPYTDSLNIHFGEVTDTWVNGINHSVFESLKSEGLSLISNKELRLRIVHLYDSQSSGQKERAIRYRDLMDEASETVLSTRFDQLWGSNYEEWGKENVFSDPEAIEKSFTPKMIPIDFEKLKTDQEFLYFLRSLRNRQFWFVRQELKSMKDAMNKLISSIQIELDILN